MIRYVKHTLGTFLAMQVTTPPTESPLTRTASMASIILFAVSSCGQRTILLSIYRQFRKYQRVEENKIKLSTFVLKWCCKLSHPAWSPKTFHLLEKLLKCCQKEHNHNALLVQESNCRGLPSPPATQHREPLTRRLVPERICCC
jgi:hypothetical protein